MKIHQCVLGGIVAGLAALAVSSCAYDPYYSGGSYSSYGGGYGDGYGYGGSSFSTSVFVRTGSSRWGYDPYAGAYYDYNRHAYYDPYLYGYYPVGYRPRYVVGSPHPHGWHRGEDYCAPPSRIRDYDLTNYQNRGDRYRSLGRDWSSNVQVNNLSRDQNSYSRSSDSSNRGSFRNGGPSDLRTSRGVESAFNGRSARTEGRSAEREGPSMTVPQRRPEMNSGTPFGGQRDNGPRARSQGMVSPDQGQPMRDRGAAPSRQDRREVAPQPQVQPPPSQQGNPSLGQPNGGFDRGGRGGGDGGGRRGGVRGLGEG